MKKKLIRWGLIGVGIVVVFVGCRALIKASNEAGDRARQEKAAERQKEKDAEYLITASDFPGEDWPFTKESVYLFSKVVQWKKEWQDGKPVPHTCSVVVEIDGEKYAVNGLAKEVTNHPDVDSSSSRIKGILISPIIDEGLRRCGAN